MCDRIDQWVNDLHELDNRTGPTMGDDQRQGGPLARTQVQKVNVEPVNLGRELGEPVQAYLARTPIIAICPVLADLPDPVQRHALAPIVNELSFRPAGSQQPRLQIRE